MYVWWIYIPLSQVFFFVITAFVFTSGIRRSVRVWRWWRLGDVFGIRCHKWTKSGAEAADRMPCRERGREMPSVLVVLGLDKCVQRIPTRSATDSQLVLFNTLLREIGETIYYYEMWLTVRGTIPIGLLDFIAAERHRDCPSGDLKEQRQQSWDLVILFVYMYVSAYSR